MSEFPCGSAGCRRKGTRRTGSRTAECAPGIGGRAIGNLARAWCSRASKAKPSSSKSPTLTATAVASDRRLGPTGGERDALAACGRRTAKGDASGRPRQARRPAGCSPVLSEPRRRGPGDRPARGSAATRGSVGRRRAADEDNAKAGLVPTKTPAVSAQGGRRRRSGMAAGQALCLAVTPAPQVWSQRSPGRAPNRPPGAQAAKLPWEGRPRGFGLPAFLVLASRLANETATHGKVTLAVRRIRVPGKRRACGFPPAMTNAAPATESCAKGRAEHTDCAQLFHRVFPTSAR